MLSNDKVMHTAQLAMLLITATILIVYGHQYIAPEIVFSSMIAGLAGIVGSRIAANGYVTGTTTVSTPPPLEPAPAPPAPPAPLPQTPFDGITLPQPAISRVPVVRLPPPVDSGG